MRKGLLLILFSWAFIAVGQEEIAAKVNYLNFDAFYESDSLIADPVLPSMGIPYAIGWKYGYFNLTKENRKNHIRIFPLLNTKGSFSNLYYNQVADLNIGAGFGLETELSKHFYARILFTGNILFRDGTGDKYTRIFANDYWKFPAFKQHLYTLQPQIRLSYTPYEFINIQAGIDQNFIGQGKRSMLLSDYSAPYPFVQLRTKIWKLEITNLYQFFDEQVKGKKINKFGSTHFFNLNATSRFKIGLFESVIFAAKDTLMNRGYEAAYLNPFLFYRPTEYGLGSQDRLLIGLNTSYQFNSWLLYGQFAFDDFVLKELIKRTRWWANKYSGQIGAKWKHQVNENIQLRWLGELNFARPFTYSHINPSTVYGHQGNSLAHPLGANFVEVYTEFGIYIHSFIIRPEFFFTQQGSNGEYGYPNHGANIYWPYNDKSFEYGYKIGGNGKVNRYHAGVEFTYRIEKLLRTDFFLHSGVEIRQMGNATKNYFFVMAGIRTALWNDRSFNF